MSTDIVLMFPGQGSQKTGMGKDLAEAFAPARAAFDEVDEALGAPLSALCFEGPADELTQTRNAQPALLAHGAAAWAVVRERIAARVRAAAGHSLGEFTAHHAAGALSLGDAARLVRRRGELMYQTGTERPGTMAAILGALTEPIETICTRASAEGSLAVPANYNDAAQVVISGEVAGVERAMELAKAAGARRAVRLNVSGAFHSPLMEPAVGGLRAALDAAQFHGAAFPVYANVDALPSSDPARARGTLLRQLTSPVRWSDIIAAMALAFPTALFVEMGPGNVLAGLVKRIAPGVTTVTCGTAAEVEALLQRLD